jgi:DNA-binding transcriptional LysR family regulator
MPQAVALFRRRHPGVALTLAEGEPEDIAPRLHAGEFDLALLFQFPGVEPAPAGNLAITSLLEDPMHVALPVEHPLATKPELSLADLRLQDWVQTSATSACARHVVRSCLAAGFEPRVTFESDDYETVQGLVAAGVGVALIPRLALTRLHPGIVVRSLEPASPVRTVVAATASGRAVAASALAMLAILEDIAPDYVDSRGWLARR